METAQDYYNQGADYCFESMKKNLLCDQYKYTTAIECFNKAIELNPNYAEAYHYLGSIYKWREDYDSAINYYQKAIEINPDYAEAYCDLGLVYAGKLNHDESIKNLTKAAQLSDPIAQKYCKENNISW